MKIRFVKDFEVTAMQKNLILVDELVKSNRNINVNRLKNLVSGGKRGAGSLKNQHTDWYQKRANLIFGINTLSLGLEFEDVS